MTATPPGNGGPRAGVAWGAVAGFVGLAYALSWGWDAIFIGPRLGALLTGPLSPADGTVVFGNQFAHLPAMVGPGLAALIVTLLAGGRIAGSLKLRQTPFPYLAALAAPAAVMAAATGLLIAVGLATPTPPAEPFTVGIGLLLAGLLVLECLLGLGEEYGWRGFLLPRLMPLGAARASLAVGVIWGLWHLPALLAGVLLGGSPLLPAFAVHLATLTVQSFAYTWLGQRTAFSPAVAAVFHGASNWSAQRALGFVAVGNAVAGFAVVGAVWLAVVAIGAIAIGWQKSRRAARLRRA